MIGTELMPTSFMNVGPREFLNIIAYCLITKLSMSFCFEVRK